MLSFEITKYLDNKKRVFKLFFYFFEKIV